MSRRRILVTLGDPAGIGPEVVAAALAHESLPGDFEFELIGDPARGRPGQPDLDSARESLRALEEAARRMREDLQVAAVVTGPVSKARLERVGFRHPGQTEFFADALDCRDYAMCLSGDHLSVALATIHIGLARVAETLSPEGIVRSGRLLADFARRRGAGRPRIAVAALNPHAGEDGRFGNEEREIIEPAIDALNALDVADFIGPEVPDGVFRDAIDGRFHGVVAMYHDQGLIPLKLLDFDNAVNVTLGLPKPRTSPDHGTAFGIAGKGIARPDSMIRALHVAADLARTS